MGWRSGGGSYDSMVAVVGDSSAAGPSKGHSCCVATCCAVLQFVAMCCNMLCCVAMCCDVVQHVVLCCQCNSSCWVR